MKETSVGLLRREEQLDRYSRLEPGLPCSPADPEKAIAGIGWLYDMLPKESRDRPVDPSGIIELHRCLSVFDSSPGS